MYPIPSRVFRSLLFFSCSLRWSFEGKRQGSAGIGTKYTTSYMITNPWHVYTWSPFIGCVCVRESVPAGLFQPLHIDESRKHIEAAAAKGLEFFRFSSYLSLWIVMAILEKSGMYPGSSSHGSWWRNREKKKKRRKMRHAGSPRHLSLLLLLPFSLSLSLVGRKIPSALLATTTNPSFSLVKQPKHGGESGALVLSPHHHHLPARDRGERGNPPPLK